MKQAILASCVLFVLAGSSVYGQPAPYSQPSPNSLPQPAPKTTSLEAPMSPGVKKGVAPIMQWNYTCVKEYMRYPSPLSPIGDGVLGMMGDEAAFYVSVVMSEMPTLTAAQTLTVLDIIHNSFKQMDAIQNIAYRKPRRSLAMLKTIQATAVDQTVKERIAAETTFLTTLPEKITLKPYPNIPARPGLMPSSGAPPKP